MLPVRPERKTKKKFDKALYSILHGDDIFKLSVQSHRAPRRYRPRKNTTLKLIRAPIDLIKRPFGPEELQKMWAVVRLFLNGFSHSVR